MNGQANRDVVRGRGGGGAGGEEESTQQAQETRVGQVDEGGEGWQEGSVGGARLHAVSGHGQTASFERHTTGGFSSSPPGSHQTGRP